MLCLVIFPGQIKTGFWDDIGFWGAKVRWAFRAQSQGPEAGKCGGHLESNAQLGSLKRQSKKKDGTGISRQVGGNHEMPKALVFMYQIPELLVTSEQSRTNSHLKLYCSFLITFMASSLGILCVQLPLYWAHPPADSLVDSSFLTFRYLIHCFLLHEPHWCLSQRCSFSLHHFSIY